MDGIQAILAAVGSIVGVICENWFVMDIGIFLPHF